MVGTHSVCAYSINFLFDVRNRWYAPASVCHEMIATGESASENNSGRVFGVVSHIPGSEITNN